MTLAALWSLSWMTEQVGHDHLRTRNGSSSSRFPHAEHVVLDASHRDTVWRVRPSSHLMQRRDALQPVLLEVAHRLGLPGSAGTAASNPRFYDTEVPVAVVRIHAPGVEPGRGGRQQDLTGELIDRLVDAPPPQPRRQPVPCRAVQVSFGRRERHLPPRGGIAVDDRAEQTVVKRGIGDHVDGGRSAGQYPVLDAQLRAPGLNVVRVYRIVQCHSKLHVRQWRTKDSRPLVHPFRQKVSLRSTLWRLSRCHQTKLSSVPVRVGALTDGISDTPSVSSGN